MHEEEDAPMDQTPMAETDGGLSTITLVVTNVVRPEHDEEFRRGAEEVAKQVRENETGTLLYALTRVPSQSLAGVEVGDVFGHTYVWVERFRDETALKAHMSAPYVGAFLGKARRWLVGTPELLQLTQIVAA